MLGRHHILARRGCCKPGNVGFIGEIRLAEIEIEPTGLSNYLCQNGNNTKWYDWDAAGMHALGVGS